MLHRWEEPVTLFNDSSKFLFPVINCLSLFYLFIHLLISFIHLYIYMCVNINIYILSFCKYLLIIFRYIGLCNVWDVEINKIVLSSGKLQSILTNQERISAHCRICSFSECWRTTDKRWREIRERDTEILSRFKCRGCSYFPSITYFACS